jgi:hypothetical protein
MAHETDQIFKEIDEDLRRERFEELWNQYGTYILAGALAIVLGVGGWKATEHLQAKRAAEAGARYQAALQLAEDKKAEEADKALQAIAGSGPAGYRALARLRLAAAEAAAGRTDAAVAAYDAIAKDSDTDAALRSLGRLRAAMLRLDTADFTEMQNRLSDLKDAKNPWHYSAKELLGLAAWKAGKSLEAEKEFQALTVDTGVPPSIRQRANMMLSLLIEAGRAPAPVQIEGAAPAAAPGKAEPAQTTPAKAPAEQKGKAGAKTN